MPKVSISPGWWAKTLKDYSSWLFAWGREAGQNSLDAGATRIDATVDDSSGNTVVRWADNGRGMSKDIIESRLMAVGGSEKDADAAGGFGVAKLILLFAHLCYVILTRNLRVTGQGGDYEIVDNDIVTTGCTLIVTFVGRMADEMMSEMRRWVRMTTPRNAAVRFYINGENVPFMGALPPACSVQDWCTLHVVDGLDSGIHVRINGQYMFSVWSSVTKCFIVELTGSSLEYLTSNRDSLQWTYRDKLQKLVELVTRDPDKLIDIESDVIELWEGSKGAALDTEERARLANAPATLVARRPDWTMGADDETDAPERNDAGMLLSTKAPDTSIVSRKANTSHDFVTMNKTNKPIPHHYAFDGMRPMEWALFDRWTRIVVAVASVLGVRRTIRTGWIFSTEAQAAYKRNAQHGSLVLLNPCKLRDGVWTKGFDTSKASFYCLVSLAVHEITHINHSGHDASYAGAFTDNLAMVLANVKVINAAR